MAENKTHVLAENPVDEIHRVVYRVLMPVLVVLGLAASALCLLVLTRPRLRSTRVNWYFVALASSDLLVCLFHIPVISTITGCTSSSYAEAWYFAHFGWTMVAVCQTFGVYIIVWLSFDRFVAVWMYMHYSKMQQQPTVKRNRLLVTAAACVIFHLGYVVLGDVKCKRGQWVSITGYMYEFEKKWHEVYRAFYGLLTRWIPNCFLIFFNTSLVVGVVQGRVNLPARSHNQGGNGERKLVIITIAITVSYVLFTIPKMIYIIFFSRDKENRCSGHHPEEVLRAVGNTLQLIEHVIHIAFYVGLSSPFRKELMYLLRLEERTEEGGGGLGEAGVKSHYRAHAERAETERRTGNNRELPRASPSLQFSSTPDRPTLSEDLDASTHDSAAL